MDYNGLKKKQMREGGGGGRGHKSRFKKKRLHIKRELGAEG